MLKEYVHLCLEHHDIKFEYFFVKKNQTNKQIPSLVKR